MPASTAPWQPTAVSVIIPALNAETIIDGCIKRILEQEVDLPVDVVVAVGPSHDETAARVQAWEQRSGGQVRLVDNPTGATPAALNLAAAACDGDLIIRVDAQAAIPAGYVNRVVATSARTGAANVGGVQRPVGSGGWSTAIAVAMSSSFGAGPASFRSGNTDGPTDTVYLGAFRRDAFEAVGGYDETLMRNQDYELNVRLRQAGFTVWLDPELVVEYQPRASLRALWRQHFEYGTWKRVVLSRNPRSLRARQLAAPALVVSVLASAVMLVVGRPGGLVVPALYGAAAFAFAARTKTSSLHKVAAAFVTMHMAWGSGFLFGRRQRR